MRSNLQRIPGNLLFPRRWVGAIGVSRTNETCDQGEVVMVMAPQAKTGVQDGQKKCGRTLHQRLQSSLTQGGSRQSGGSARTRLGRSNPSHRYIRVKRFTV